MTTYTIKTCGACGKGNMDDASGCWRCGTAFDNFASTVTDPPRAIESEPTASSRELDPTSSMASLSPHSSGPPEPPERPSQVAWTPPNAGALPPTFCRACGSPIDSRASICPGCGVAQDGAVPSGSGHTSASFARQGVAARFRPTTWVGFAGAGALLLGSIGPWATVSFLGAEISKSGTSGDGGLTFILAIIGAIFVYLAAARSRKFAGGALGCGGVAALVSLYDLANIGGSYEGVVSAGWGLYLCLLASIGLCVASGLHLLATASRGR